MGISLDLDHSADPDDDDIVDDDIVDDDTQKPRKRKRKSGRDTQASKRRKTE